MNNNNNNNNNKAIELPIKHGYLFKNKNLNLKPCSGVLLYGPPGTGKTLLAKAVATEFAMSFMSVKGPELLNMYVGQSEANIRNLFKNARLNKPCVIFFDEIDGLIRNRGKSSDSGNVMDRIVSQFLTEMDNDILNENIFLMAATNRPDLLDPSLLRPGRIDKLIYLGPPKEINDKIYILNAITRKFHFKFENQKENKFDILKYISHLLPQYATGADLYALCADTIVYCAKKLICHFKNQAKLQNMSIQIYLQSLNYSHFNVFVSQNDFLHVLQTFQISVNQNEINKYQQMQNTTK